MSDKNFYGEFPSTFGNRDSPEAESRSLSVPLDGRMLGRVAEEAARRGMRPEEYAREIIEGHVMAMPTWSFVIEFDGKRGRPERIRYRRALRPRRKLRQEEGNGARRQGRVDGLTRRRGRGARRLLGPVGACEVRVDRCQRQGMEVLRG